MRIYDDLQPAYIIISVMMMMDLAVCEYSNEAPF